MVVGEAGLGKTTLLESFFKSFKDDEAAFALFERKETATEIETRKQLSEAQASKSKAERELQAAIETAQYAAAHQKQIEIARLTRSIEQIGRTLKDLSLADERSRNELRCLREATRALRLEMKRSADSNDFVTAAEFQLEANLLQAECDSVQGELKQMRRGSDDKSPQASMMEDDEDVEEDRMRAGHKALTNATVTVKAFDPFCISVGKHELQVTLVDTPGYGETLHTEESFEVICSYVDSLFERQLRAESSWSARDAERMRLQDPLVHVCLYFVAPHRLKHIDIAFMRALHKKVNIVPIIAKSDTMTTKEKDEFKMQVREALKTEGIEAYPFDVSTLRAMEQQDKIEYRMPWAVIGSTDAYLDAGATVYLRKYPWGNALSSEPAHSDLPALRNMIMWSGQWHDLKMAARAKYEAWRCERPLRKRSSAALHILGRACVNKCRKAVDAVTRGRDAVVRAGASACVAVGVPPRYGARAFLILLLGLTAYAGPPAVRWATGTDLSAPHKLALARNQVERLVLEKSKLVEKYEKDLNALRLKLDNANGFSELQVQNSRVAENERWELQKNVRAATTRAELAEAALESATSECTMWNPIMAGVRAAGSKVQGAAGGVYDGAVDSSRKVARAAGEAVVGMAKETPTILGHATRQTIDLSRDGWLFARRLVEKLRIVNDTDRGFTVHPVG